MYSTCHSILLTELTGSVQDVTNHQINHLTLIQGFVSFQQTEILRIISTGDIDISGSFAWFDSYRIPDETMAPLSREGGIWTFFRGFVDLLLHPNTAPTPDTLELDNERIADIRKELLDAVNLDICKSLFEIIDETIIPSNMPAAEGGIDASSRVQFDSRTIKRNRLAHVRSTLRAIVDDYSNPDIDPSSPLTSSPLNFEPWKAAAPALALEMLRNANVPLSNPYFENTLAETLSNPSNEQFRHSERRVFRRLEGFVQKYVNAWQPLDSVTLYKVAPVCPNGCKIHGEPKEMERLDEMARRIAHLGILHWNVWGKIAYLVIPNERPNHWSEIDWDTVELTNGS